MANLLYHLSIQIFWGNKSFTGWLFLPYMQNYLWDHGSVWDTGLKQEVSDYIQCRWGGRKELTSMCSQVKSQVFTGYCTTFVCVLGLKPNKHFDCSGVIYFQEENLTSILTIKGSKDSFRISHFKFGFFFFFYLITYILVDCVAQGSCEWWEKEEKCFCSSWSHWKSRDGLLFNYSRKSWRSSAEEMKNWPSPVFWSWSFSQSSQSSGVRSIKNHRSTFRGTPPSLRVMRDNWLCLRLLHERGSALAEQHLLAASRPFLPRCGCSGLWRREVPGQGHPYTAVLLQSASPV